MAKGARPVPSSRSRAQDTGTKQQARLRKPRKKSKTRQQRPSGVLVDRDELARRAYELYQLRGCAHGHDVEDWLEAERSLMENLRRYNGRRRKRGGTGRDVCPPLRSAS